MKRKEKLILIDGVFSGDDANEILMNIFTTKIAFHEVKNFGSQERNGKEDKSSLKRMTDLKKERDKLKLIIAEAKANNKRLTIKSEINIVLSDHK